MGFRLLAFSEQILRAAARHPEEAVAHGQPGLGVGLAAPVRLARSVDRAQRLAVPVALAVQVDNLLGLIMC